MSKTTSVEIDRIACPNCDKTEYISSDAEIESFIKRHPHAKRFFLFGTSEWQGSRVTVEMEIWK